MNAFDAYYRDMNLKRKKLERAGFVQLKFFVMATAEKCGLSPSAIYSHLSRGRLKPKKIVRLNQRVVFVK